MTTTQTLAHLLATADPIALALWIMKQSGKADRRDVVAAIENKENG